MCNTTRLAVLVPYISAILFRRSVAWVSINCDSACFDSCISFILLLCGQRCVSFTIKSKNADDENENRESIAP